MSGLVAIFRRELAGLFLQPTAWVLLALALLLQGIVFTMLLQFTGGEVRFALSSIGGSTAFFLIVTVLPPLITMRMIAEESRSGVLEYLLTAPVGDAAVALGKLLAAIVFFSLLWLMLPAYGLLVGWLGAAPDWGQIAGAYLGAVLLSGLFCSIGLFTSALTSAPTLAAFIAFCINVLFLVAPSLRGRIPMLDARLQEQIFRKIDVIERYQVSFLRGVVDTGHLVFFLAWTAAFLFLTVRLLDMRRWR